LPALIMKWV
jgi:hypothetical protein